MRIAIEVESMGLFGALDSVTDTFLPQLWESREEEIAARRTPAEDGGACGPSCAHLPVFVRATETGAYEGDVFFALVCSKHMEFKSCSSVEICDDCAEGIHEARR